LKKSLNEPASSEDEFFIQFGFDKIIKEEIKGKKSK